MDWSKTENIIFVSVVGAAILFFLATTIAVIAKGKRTCKAGDVLLRIVSSLVFACSTVLLVCVILSQLTGGYRIDTTDAPTLYFGAHTVTLPIPQLFSAIATTVGSDLVTGIFVISLVALVCDCLLANKKKAKKQTADDSAPVVPETENTGTPISANAAATSDETVMRDENAPVEDDEKTTEPVGENDVTDGTPDIDDAPTGSDDVAQTDAQEDIQEDKPWYNEDGEFDLDADAPETDTSSEVEADTAYFAESDETTDEQDDDISGSVEAGAPDETYEYASDGFEPTEQADDAGEPDIDDGYADADTDGEGEKDLSFEQGSESKPEPETEPERYDEDEIARGERELEELLSRPIEPDRDIYIPEVRTVKRGGGKSATGGKKAAKPTAKKSAKAAETTTTKPKNRSTSKSKAQKESAATDGDGKTLPMGRRYVIIDRRSAVNIFSDYLKERDRQDKEKLESSINKIILK